MLVCNKCGYAVEDSELSVRYEHHGHTSLGNSFTEAVDERCSCGGEFVEATKCAVCGEWFDNDGLYGVCENCIEEHETVGDALAFGENDPVSVAINGFVADVLSPEHINKILTKWVEENVIDHSKEVCKYINRDKALFSEHIEYEFGKE